MPMRRVGGARAPAARSILSSTQAPPSDAIEGAAETPRRQSYSPLTARLRLGWSVEV